MLTSDIAFVIAKDGGDDAFNRFVWSDFDKGPLALESK